MLPLFDDNPHRRTPVIVGVTIVACVVVMAVEYLQRSPAALDAFVAQWGLVPATLWHEPDARVWASVLTSMFLHGDWLHLLGNCWFLWIFGNNIEDRLGHARFVVFYVLSGLAAAAAQVAVAPHSLLPMIGASGAISGVLGAYCRYFPLAPIYTLVPLWFAPIIPIPAFLFLIAWFAFQFWQGVGTIMSTGVTGGVAWWAHIGGFIAGMLLAGPMKPRGRRR